MSYPIAKLYGQALKFAYGIKYLGVLLTDTLNNVQDRQE